jgi:hypothetical protein
LNATRILYVLAALFLVLGLGIRVAGTAGPGSANAAPALAPFVVPAAPISPAADPAPFQGIVESNIFSTERSAPRARYAPPAAGTSEEMAEAPAPRASADIPGPRLSGIVITPGTTVALIEGGGGAAGAHLYRVGDAIAGGRVAAITDSAVVIRGAAGRRVLRLHSPARPAHP